MYFLTPGIRTVSTPWGTVRVKTAEGYGVTHEKPEYADVAALAQENGLPYRTVEREVIRRLEEERA